MGERPYRAGRPPVAGIAVAAILVLAKFALTREFTVQALFAPHDDLLYVERAFRLLQDGTLGTFDARTLSKPPGFSILLALLAAAGVPYVPVLIGLHAAAGLYLLGALRGRGIADGWLLAAFALHLFNPLTLDAEYFRAMREPLAGAMLLLALGAALRTAVAARDGRIDIVALGILSVVVATMPLVREADILVFAIPMLAALLGAFPSGRMRWRIVAAIVIVPLASAFLAEAGLRGWVSRTYGMPILHDFGEGAYPRLVAAIRSVKSARDNRHVMVSQETVARLRAAVPEFAAVAERLPRPGPGSYSCVRVGVCSEWTNGYMLFWLKDAAFDAASDRSLAASQEHMARLRERILAACDGGSLQCGQAGGGLFPAFELRWSRALLQELSGAVGMLLRPVYSAPGPGPQGPVDRDTARMYTAVLGVAIDSGMVIGSTTERSDPVARGPGEFALAVVRGLTALYRACTWLIILVAVVGFVHAACVAGDSILRDGVACAFVLCAGWALLAVASLSYVSVYMASLDMRLYAPAHGALLLAALPMFVRAIAIGRMMPAFQSVWRKG